MKNSQKLLSSLCHQKKFIFFLCMYKMVDIIAETWNKVKVSVTRIHENDNVNETLLKLLFISAIAKKWGGKNLYDLINKEIKGKCGVTNMIGLTEQQIRKYKIDRAKLIKGSKCYMYVHEDIAVTIIMQSRLSDPKTIKFRSDLGFNQINLILKKKIISSNIIIKSIFCRKNKAVAQSFKKRKIKN